MLSGETENLIDSVPEFVARIREEAGPDVIPSRQEAEDEARRLLDQVVGHMTEAQAQELGRILNRHSRGGTMRHDRFVPALSTPLINQMVADLDRFNELTLRLWKGSEEEALATADRIFREPSTLPGSGRSYPSILLYLRDPGRFAAWFSSTDEGLGILTDHQTQGRAEGSDAYLRFCDRALAFARDYDLEPQEVDLVLSSATSEASRRKNREREREAAPTLGREAFAFLAELRENNTKEWFDTNRHRYEQHLRDPLARVFEAVAARYIVGLDPLLNTTVKRDEVLARIYRYGGGDPYYDYYWGAFSREKKQEDVQLFVNTHWDQLRFGLYLGSAPDEARTRLIEGLRRGGEELLHSLLPALEGLRWEPDYFGPPLEVETVDQAVAWVEGKEPGLVRVIPPDDPLIGSPDLVDEIGRVLRAVHPLAALAWGDAVEPGDVSRGEEPPRPPYAFEELQADTLLPAELLEEWISLLAGPKGAALFYGPPGTGKTHVVEHLARYLAGTEGDTRTVQFHPSFTYEDFIEGLRPEVTDGGLTYEVRPGVFYRFCEEARGQDADYVFVIDEINRAELGAVLGEVMMLIEYRDRSVPLPYSHRKFSIPRNVVVLATMNTADRSLALVDFALRRRFHAFRMFPSREVLSRYFERQGADGDLALRMFDLVQGLVEVEDYAPGHTYWMADDTSAQGLERIWRYELRPYLEEYWFESRERLRDLDQAVLELLAEGA